jgi:hypothetical protein
MISIPKKRLGAIVNTRRICPECKWEWEGKGNCRCPECGYYNGGGNLNSTYIDDLQNHRNLGPMQQPIYFAVPSVEMRMGIFDTLNDTNNKKLPLQKFAMMGYSTLKINYQYLIY